MLVISSLLLGLLLTPSAALTTLSSNNCPANFDLAAHNSTGSSLSAAVDFLYSNLYSAEEQAKIQSAFYSGDTATITSKVTSLSIIIPFAVIAFAFLLTFVIAVCCCIFQKSCPPCKSWKRDFSTRPYQKSQLKCVMVFSLLFAISITLTTIIGFVFFPTLSTDIQNTKCGLYTTLDVALNGDQTNNWGGFTQISTQIGNVSSQLTTTSTAVSTDLSGNQWLKTSMEALKEQNVDLYKNNFQSTVLSPNPTTTATAVSGNTALPTVVPLFISAGLGPNGTSNTMVTDIDSGIQVTQQVSSQGYTVLTSALLLANSANEITSNMNVAINSMTQSQNYLTSIQVSIDALSNSMFDNLFNWGLYLIQGILGFILAASLLLILGIISTHSLQLYGCRTSVHLGWVTFGVTYFGIVILSFIFFSFGGVSYQFCEFYSSLLSSDTSFNAYAQVTGPNQYNRFFQKLQTCFYGDGNIMSEFALRQEMSTISNLYAEINTFLDMRDSTKATYVDTAFSPTKITGWVSAMQNYRLGIYDDADPALTSEDNPRVAIQGMNKYTNNGTAGTPPSCTNDYWVFDNTNCTNNSTQTLYVSTTSPGTTFASSGTSCISFNQKFQSQNSYTWRVSDISNRYVSRRQCSGNTQSYAAIMSYAQSLVNYRDSRINLYQNLKDQLNALLTANNNFNTNLATFTTSVNTFVTSTQTMNTLVTNAINGLDASSNCTTLANHIRFVYNTFCLNFMYSSVQFGICCLVLLALMIGGTITGCVFGIRYGRVSVDMKAVRPQTASVRQLKDLHSETFERKQQSSSSSSSSSDQD